MFARILEFIPKMEKRDELIKVVRNEILPILKKQTGFVDFLPFTPELKHEKVVTVSLWTEKMHFERYEREWFPKVENILRPYLTSPIVYKTFTLETTLCEHFEKVMAA
jgi:quinol monooxygenase YgiN